MMEMSVLNSGYSEVPRTDFVGVHTQHVGGHSDDAVSSRTPVYATVGVMPSDVSSKLHYSDAGPHREMAVDCPANFVGVKKEPPRLPRPLSNVIQTGSPSSAFKSSQTSLTSPAKMQPTSASSLSVHSQPAIAVDPVDAVGSTSKSQFNRDEHDRSERLRRYQEELAKRREMEERINQEQEQLRASLRGSKKMQGLEEKRARAHVQAVRDGFDNPNYRADDETDRMLPVYFEPNSQKQNVKDHNIIHMSKSSACLDTYILSEAWVQFFNRQLN